MKIQNVLIKIANELGAKDISGIYTLLNEKDTCSKAEIIDYLMSKVIGIGSMCINGVGSLGRCNKCEKKASLRCGKCKVIRYCSQNCQLKDRETHKTICTNLASTRQEIMFSS